MHFPWKAPSSAAGIAFFAIGVLACGPNVEGGRGTGQIPQLGTASATAGNSGPAMDYSHCPEIEIPNRLGYHGGGSYTAPIDEDQDLGDDGPNNPDFFTIELRSPRTGDFPLDEEDNQSYAECSPCVILSQDNGDKFLFQVSGLLDVTDDSRPMAGDIEVDAEGVVLVEVEIDEETFATEIVEDGDCVRIEDNEFKEKKVPGWKCFSGFFGTGDGCDCGCGIVDDDCANDSVNVCEFCDSPGSCNEATGVCPGGIAADDNAVCDPEAVWTCDFTKYGANDGCDCGCGIVDSDCSNIRAKQCDTCDLPGSCFKGDDSLTCVETINAVNSALCSPVEGWTCDPLFHGTDDGCDCGCGLVDPDCNEDDGRDACEFCENVGACSAGEGECPANIRNGNTGACQ